jgi:hypothetical protein
MSLWVEKAIAQSRYNTCKGCDKFIASSARCLECGCFMKVKVKLLNATCPVGKW